MRKRFLAWVLTLVMVCTLLPMPASALRKSESDAIRALAVDLVKKQSASVYSAQSADNAFKSFCKYGFFGRGAKQNFNDGHAFVSALWNTGMFPEAIIEGISAAIPYLQDYGHDALYMSGWLSWHSFYYDYAYYCRLTDGEGYEQYVGNFASSTEKYGKNQHYQGSRNKNDDLMELVAGMISTDMNIRCVEKTETYAVYNIDLIVSDEFEFVGGYDRIAEKGFDTSDDEQIANLGFLLSYVGLDEFKWEYKKSFTLQVPFHCDHGAESYRWVYDGYNMVPQTDDGFTANPTEHLECEVKDSEGQFAYMRQYFRVDKPITLYHDVPWVVEYDQTGMRSVQLSSRAQNSYTQPIFYPQGSRYIRVHYILPEALPEGQTNSQGGTTREYHYWLGVDMHGQYNYNSKHTYTTRIENVVNADGSNMFYATLIDKDLGEVVFGPEPMDDLWCRVTDSGEKTESLIATDSNQSNGMDISIGYIGNKTSGFVSDMNMDIRIYEGGLQPADDGTYCAPTCIRQGGVLHHCRTCGLDYYTEEEAALGHDYGEFTDDHNVTCTTDGTKTRTCARCGETETVTLSGTATGHAYGDYVSDGNATCTADGTKTAVCGTCGDTITAADTGTAAGHDYGDYIFDGNATCTADGTKTRTCTRCGETETVTAAGTATGHKHEAVIIAPTCTEGGYTTYTCHCGDTHVSDYTEAAGHTPVIDPAVAPTCISKGLTEGSHCEACGLVIKKQAAISQVKDHTMDEGEVVKEATYTTGGTMLYTCIHCGKEAYVSIPALTEPVNPFTDVQVSDWFYAPVLWAVGNNITTGKTATTFAPHEGCTRAQVVTFLWAAAGRPEPNSMDNPFTDVANDAWYLKPVLWAVENGITGGVSEGEFGPEQKCNRAQIATFLWAAKGKQAAGDVNGFSDVNASDWYATAVAWAKEQGITDGIGGGKFGPNDSCTRAQVVTFLKKAYE